MYNYYVICIWREGAKDRVKGQLVKKSEAEGPRGI